MNEHNLGEQLEIVFATALQFSDPVAFFGFVEKLLAHPDFVLIDTTSNPARSYIYTKKGNRVSQVMIHNLKQFDYTTWSIWFEIADGELKHGGTQDHWKCLPEGLYVDSATITTENTPPATSDERIAKIIKVWRADSEQAHEIDKEIARELEAWREAHGDGGYIDSSEFREFELFYTYMTTPADRK